MIKVGDFVYYADPTTHFSLLALVVAKLSDDRLNLYVFPDGMSTLGQGRLEIGIDLGHMFGTWHPVHKSGA